MRLKQDKHRALALLAVALAICSFLWPTPFTPVTLLLSLSALVVSVYVVIVVWRGTARKEDND